MRAMWHDGSFPRLSHQRTTLTSAQSSPDAMSNLPSWVTRVSPASLHVMESRDAMKVARPVWREGWRKPHGAIDVWRLCLYSTQISLQRRRSPRPQGLTAAPTPRRSALAPKISPFHRKSLYRAVDKYGETIDFLLTEHRDQEAKPRQDIRYTSVR